MNKEPDKIIKALKDYQKKITPPKQMLSNLLSSLPDRQARLPENQPVKKPVTNLDLFRYNYVMGTKVLIPAGLIILVIAVFLFARGLNKPATETAQTQSPASQVQTTEVPNQPVTAQNADSSLAQTDQAIQSNINELDKDLQSLDQNDSSQDNTNNL